MRYTFVVLPALWCLVLGSGSRHDSYSGRRFLADYVFVPAGELDDSILSEFYISSIEVTNRQYRAFISDLIDSGEIAKAREATPDTNRWLDAPCHAAAFVHSYYQDPAYDGYPVVNITKHDAALYCAWLTERYNRTSRQKVLITLPTEIQWMYAAMGGNAKAIYPWPGNALLYTHKGKWHGTLMCNYHPDSALSASAQYNKLVDFAAPSRSYMPNTYDIYNMGGNVAEMILDQDYTKGGSFLSTADKVRINAYEMADLTHGSPAVGFRPVMMTVAREKSKAAPIPEPDTARSE